MYTNDSFRYPGSNRPSQNIYFFDSKILIFKSQKSQKKIFFFEISSLERVLY